ncbi:MAG: hypothetical protein ACI8VE_002148 [Natrialbaceae archaeon]|jgi:hypothetical protein
MQRRAAAAYVAFFLVIAAGSYGVIAMTEAPNVDVRPGEAEHTLKNGTTFTVDDRVYTVMAISDGEQADRTATLEWVNESERITESWVANTTVTVDNQTYRVVIPNVSAPESFQLRPEPGDWANPRWDAGQQVVDVDVDEDEFVENGVPVGQFIAGNESLTNRTIKRDATVPYAGNETQVVELTTESATLEWTADKTYNVELAHGSNATLGDRQFLAYFPDESTVYLDSAESTQYFDRAADANDYSNRMNGFWAVSILSGFATVLLMGLAYMPRRR